MLTSATRGEMLTNNPNECNSTLTSGTRGIYPYLYIAEESVPCAKFCYFEHFRSTMYTLDAALAWKTCNFSLTKKLPCSDSLFTKNYWTILRSLEAFLFQMNRDNGGNSIDLISVGICPLSLSDYKKKEIIRSMNLINGFDARGYSIRGIHLPIVLLT